MSADDRSAPAERENILGHHLVAPLHLHHVRNLDDRVLVGLRQVAERHETDRLSTVTIHYAERIRMALYKRKVRLGSKGSFEISQELPAHDDSGINTEGGALSNNLFTHGTSTTPTASNVVRILG